MLKRCYCDKYKSKNSTYSDCDVCSEWLRFSNFEKWVREQNVENLSDFDLDKDLFSDGCKRYSPQTCCLIPHRINTAIASHGKTRKGTLPVGVYKRERGRYRAIVEFGDKNRLASFSTAYEARDAYIKAKTQYIKALAYDNYAIGVISKRIYDKLMNLKISNI